MQCLQPLQSTAVCEEGEVMRSLMRSPEVRLGVLQGVVIVVKLCLKLAILYQCKRYPTKDVFWICTLKDLVSNIFRF